MVTIRYANINDAKILGEIHAKSWQVAYKGIVPEEILVNITPERRQKYFEKALTEGWRKMLSYIKIMRLLALFA